MTALVAEPLLANRQEIARFVGALFRYADPGTFVSLRSFHDDEQRVFAIEAHQLGDDPGTLTHQAVALATRAARFHRPVVFAPPIATFSNAERAAEADLANGLALSVECDRAPSAARARLEAILGPATIVVASGGEWTNPETGEVEPKLHLHWRLNEPTRDEVSHAALKQARGLATLLAGGDPSGKPAVHPMRWPGSWHRKAAPRLARIVAEADAEIDLQEVLERLQDACAASAGSAAGTTDDASFHAANGESRDTAELIRAILAGEDYHAPIAALSMRLLKGGVPDAQVVLTLRGAMLAVPAETRDLKDGKTHTGRWQARYDDVPRAVSTARAKIGEKPAPPGDGPARDGWPEPVDFLADDALTGAPLLRADHLPDALHPFIVDTAARMGVDPSAVAVAALVTCASVTHEDWRIQPKRHDGTWTEAARIWGAIVGDPSILKSPVIAACTRPVEALEAEARRHHAAQMERHRREAQRIKAEGGDLSELGPPPRLDRYLVEGATVEALSEVLRDDGEARHHVPCGRVLIRQDEMSEWIASFDRYRSGGRGGGDRGAYLRLYNGGRYVVDRVGRGSFAVPSWSGCVLGGIQPEPIQRIAQEAADDGLLQRFLYCVPARQEPGLDKVPDWSAISRYERLVAALAALQPRGAPGGMIPCAEEPRRPTALTLAPEAHVHREAIDDLARALASLPDTSARLKAALGKWPGLFARLCLLFHVIDAADPDATGDGSPTFAAVVPEPTARRVATLMREVLLPHLLRAEAVMFSTAQTGHARWIAGFILSRGGAKVAQRDIVQAYGALRPPEKRRELHEVMESLVAMGWVRPEASSNPAKAPAAWEVNPAVHQCFAARARAEREAREGAQARMRARVRTLSGGRV